MARPVSDDDHPGVEAALSLLPPASEARGGLRDDASDTARRSRAVTLRLSGLTYAQVAEECGYTNASAARQSVLASLNHYEAAHVTELRTEENARLDRAQAAIWPKVLGGDLKAVDTYLRLSARRARMNGLDAPQQVQVSSGAQAALQDALADLRTVVLGEVLDVEADGDDEDA